MMHSTKGCFCVALLAIFSASPGLLAAGTSTGDGKSFLGGARSDHLAQDELFRAAMDEIMGCGDDVGAGTLVEVEAALQPIWRVLPKNKHGRVQWRLLRYMAHRYFMQQSSMMIRGFEPQNLVNDSHLGTPSLFKGQASNLVDAVFRGKQAATGFSLDDAVTMVATLQQLARNQESTLLEAVYSTKHLDTRQHLDHVGFASLIESYMAQWLMADDVNTVARMTRAQLLETFPRWDDVAAFARGVVKTLEYTRERAPQPGHARAAMTHMYSFDDAREAVSGITKTFASFWETECQAIKSSLVEMDTSGTGRVPLSKFYGANSDGEWRFGESEAYLRELGALDESSLLRGKQVIIPNYMQGASNCIATTDHYLVCCVNECEGVLNEVEASIGSPVALPSDILDLVGNMTNYNDDQPPVDASLRKQLAQIAEINGGKVPLHGRLFAQWLHYVFPQECPFPHKAGDSAAISPSEFGDNFMVTEEEVQQHAEMRHTSTESSENIASKDDALAPWMSQWAEEEELIADYSQHIWSARAHLREFVVFVLGLFVLCFLLWSATRSEADNTKHGDVMSSAASLLTASAAKTHFV